MIVFVPDAVRLDAAGCLCTPHRCDCLSRRRKTLVDIGLRAAQAGADAASYLRLVSRAVAASEEAYAVVPDAFCNPAKTVEHYMRYAPAIRRRGAKAVLVLQSFYRDFDAYGELIHDADVVALPARRHCDVSCSAHPRLCAERIERALRWLGSTRVHLLGPAARVLKALGPAALRHVHSFDTASYRRAPNMELKMRNGGRWNIPRGAEEEWLLAWLRQAGVDEVLNLRGLVDQQRRDDFV